MGWTVYGWHDQRGRIALCGLACSPTLCTLFHCCMYISFCFHTPLFLLHILISFALAASWAASLPSLPCGKTTNAGCSVVAGSMVWQFGKHDVEAGCMCRPNCSILAHICESHRSYTACVLRINGQIQVQGDRFNLAGLSDATR